ncbi:MAG: cupin domain-containing protein [Pseudomonadota bacterium]
MSKYVMNIADVELQPRPPMFTAKGEAAERFDARMGVIGIKLGARKLGYNITAVPPGKRAYPLHNHLVNEEMFLILQGGGELRIGAERLPLRTGDVVACPAGGQDVAHQIINTGTEELRYLAVSTRLYPEHVEYPDSGKFATIAERPPAADGTPQIVRFVGRPEQSIDYWEGE